MLLVLCCWPTLLESLQRLELLIYSLAKKYLIMFTHSLKKVLLSGLLVGTLDILAAFVDVYINNGKPLGVLNYIATGAFGKTDFTASNAGAVTGLLFHYIIAFAFTFFSFGCMAKQSCCQKTGSLQELFTDYSSGW